MDRSTTIEAGPTAGPDLGIRLERRGRSWLLWSFLFCPCHLPLTLGILAAVLGGTALGAFVRDNALVAGGVLTATWVAGTAYGLRLIRQAQRNGGACSVRSRPAAGQP
jgi:hypothetical protein